MDVDTLKKLDSIDGKWVKLVGNSYIVTKAFEVYIPTEYEPKGLYTIVDETTINVLGVLGIVNGDEYATMKFFNMFATQPDSTSTVTIDGISYYVLAYSKGSIFMKDNVVIKSPSIVDAVLQLFLFRAYIPWFMDKLDLVALFTTASLTTGLAIDKNPAIMEFLVDYISQEDGSYIGLNMSINDSTFRQMLSGREKRNLRIMVSTDKGQEPSKVETALR